MADLTDEEVEHAASMAPLSGLSTEQLVAELRRRRAEEALHRAAREVADMARRTYCTTERAMYFNSLLDAYRAQRDRKGKP